MARQAKPFGGMLRGIVAGTVMLVGGSSLGASYVVINARLRTGRPGPRQRAPREPRARLDGATAVDIPRTHVPQELWR